MSVIRNSNLAGTAIAGGLLLFPAALTVISAKAQFLDQVKINSISQLSMIYSESSKNCSNVLMVQKSQFHF